MMTQLEQKPSATATFMVGTSDFAGESNNSSFNSNAPQEPQASNTAELGRNGLQHNKREKEREEAIYEEGSSNDDEYIAAGSDEKNKSDDVVEDDGNTLDTSSDLMFKKKEVNSRTQSFHSVLSAASLKSLNHQFKQPYNNHPRNNSMSSTANTYNSKNFQSFIQAPVLSSISNLKSMETEKDIGKQLPFQNKNMSDNSVNELVESPNNNDNYDEELIIQQQKLTLNALKKLSLSPMPISKSDEDVIKKTVSRKSSITKMEKVNSKNRNTEPYQPAEVDLSSFASLTRQPKTYSQMNREDSKAGVPHNKIGHRIQINNDSMKENNISDVPNNTDNISTNNNNNNNNNSNNNDNNVQTESHKTNGPSSNATNTNQNDLHENTYVKRTTNFQDNKNNINKLYNNGISSHIHVMNDQDNNTQASNRQAVPGRNSNKENTYLDQSTQNFTSIGDRNKIPAAVVPPQNMNIRSNSNQNISSIQVQSHISNGSQVLQPQPTKQLQQIKGFRSPMYVPAVLRFTKSVSPNKALNIQPGYENGHPSVSHSDGMYRRQFQPMNATLSRMASTDSMKSYNSNLSVESNSSTAVSRSQSPSYLGSKNANDGLRGEPTRKHWLKDESVLKCGIPTCSKVFNFFERRHHCRKCGGIYCKEHTSHFLYINHLAQFTTGGRGTLSKVCDYCIKEYNEFVANEFGIHQSATKDKDESKNKNVLKDSSKFDTDTNPTSPTKNRPYMATKNITKKEVGNSNDARGDQLVGSVPANWSWSSF